MKKQSLIVSVLVIIIAVGLGIYLLKRPVEYVPKANEVLDQKQSITVAMVCDSEKTITATFYLPEDSAVDLVLSDGRTMSVPHALSASGARYATEDERFVFWTKGDTAFITEGDTTTYENCMVMEVTPNWIEE